jgi:hypothetical protein
LRTRDLSVPSSANRDAGPSRRPNTGLELTGPELAGIVGNGIDLTDIPWTSVLLALVIISEIGTGMSRRKTLKHFASRQWGVSGQQDQREQ